MYNIFPLTSNRIEQAVICHNGSNVNGKFAFLSGNGDCSI